MSEYDTSEENKLTLLAERKNWVKNTSDTLNFDVEDVLDSIGEIRNQEDLEKRITALAIHIMKFVDNQKLIRKTVAQHFIDIRRAGEKLGFSKAEIRKIAESIFRKYGISDSHIRKVIPHELKDQSRTNLRFKPNSIEAVEYDNEFSTDDMPTDTEIQLKNAVERIKELEGVVRNQREQLNNSIMIGQETRIYRGFVSLDNAGDLPVIIAVNLKDNKLEYVEIDTEAIRQQHEIKNT